MLAEALDSLLALRPNPAFSYEILVVDNASTDDTRAVVEAATTADSKIKVRYDFEPKRGVASARNRGVQTATADWIASFDDDQIAESNWLNELFGIAIAKNVRCAGGRVELLQPSGANRWLGPVCRDLLSETINEPAASAHLARYQVAVRAKSLNMPPTPLDNFTFEINKATIEPVSTVANERERAGRGDLPHVRSAQT